MANESHASKANRGGVSKVIKSEDGTRRSVYFGLQVEGVVTAVGGPGDRDLGWFPHRKHNDDDRCSAGFLYCT